MIKKVFISYNWESDEEAKKISDVLQENGISITIDRKDLKYKQSIKKFMNSIKEHNFAIILISYNYLISENCMYEFLKAFGEEECKKKILPIILIEGFYENELTMRENFTEEWKLKVKKYKNEITRLYKEKKVNLIKTVADKKNNCEEIYNKLKKILDYLFDSLMINFNQEESQNFKTILEEIGINSKERIKYLYNEKFNNTFKISTEKEYSIKKMEKFLEKFYPKIESIRYDFLLGACPMILERDYYMLISLQEILDTFVWKDKDFLPLIKEFKSMSLIIKNLIMIMSGHMEYLLKDKIYRVSREYKRGFNPNYDKDVEKYNKVNFLIGNLTIELICSENYIKELTEEYFKDFSLKKEIRKRVYIFSEMELEVYTYKEKEHHFIDYFKDEMVSLENFDKYLKYILKERGTYVPSWGYRRNEI